MDKGDFVGSKRSYGIFKLLFRSLILFSITFSRFLNLATHLSSSSSIIIVSLLRSSLSVKMITLRACVDHDDSDTLETKTISFILRITKNIPTLLIAAVVG